MISARTNSYYHHRDPSNITFNRKKFDSALNRIQIPAFTGPMSELKDQSVLGIDDLQNTTRSAHNLGFNFLYGQFHQLIRKYARSCSLHSFYSIGNSRQAAYEKFLKSQGWIPHPIGVEHYNGKRYSNADNQILCYAGHLASRSNANIIAILSGDGELTNDIARFIASLPKTRKVVTISLAGSTSYRLDASRNHYITANIEIGMDCLQRSSRTRPYQANRRG